MKRLIASIAVLLTVTIYLISCEKDDLCADGTPTTPGLVVEFYKADNQTVLNTVTNFVYYVPGSSTMDTLTSGSKIVLPLKTDADEVTWALQYNSTTSQGVKSSNTDLFTIKYSRTQTYVSRACGYKTTFTILPAIGQTNNPSISDDDGNLYIKTPPVVVTPNIETEDEVHVKIFF